jgi:hypothetical protein
MQEGVNDTLGLVRGHVLWFGRLAIESKARVVISQKINTEPRMQWKKQHMMANGENLGHGALWLLSLDSNTGVTANVNKFSFILNKISLRYNGKIV